MKKMMLGLWTSAALATISHGQLVFFDFNTTPSSPPVTEDTVSGTPTVSLQGTDVIGAGEAGNSYVDFSGTAHSAGLAGAYGNGMTAGNNQIAFSVNTTGLLDLVLSYDYRSDSTGPTISTLFYFNGLQFILIDNDAYVRDGNYHRISRDLSAVSGVENAGSIFFVWSSFGGGSGTGTFRMDNLELTTVPEPHEAAVLVGLALLAFAAWHRSFVGRKSASRACVHLPELAAAHHSSPSKEIGR